MTSSERQWKTHSHSVCKGKWKSYSQDKARVLWQYDVATLGNVTCSLRSTCPAYTQGIARSREECSKLKQASPQSHVLAILINFRRLFGSSSCLFRDRSDISYVLSSWDDNDTFFSLSEKWVTPAVGLEVPVSVNPGSHADIFQLWVFYWPFNWLCYNNKNGVKIESFIRCSWKKWVVLVICFCFTNLFWLSGLPFLSLVTGGLIPDTTFSLQALLLLYP